MQNIWAIYAKEMRIYLTTWTSYLLGGAFVWVFAFFFYELVKEFQIRLVETTSGQAAALKSSFNLTDWVITPVLINASIFFLFFVPILCMRLLAEERKSKTMELLMTTPLRPLEIVLGKYLAALSIVATMLVLTLVFPLSLDILGRAEHVRPLDWSTVATAYLGLFLFSASTIALALFASSLSESQIVAAILGFAFLFTLWFIGSAGYGESGVWARVLEYLTITVHLENFVRGIIRLSDVVYYISLTGIGLLLSHRTVEAQRWR